MQIHTHSNDILSELRKTLEGVDERAAERLIEMTLSAKRVFVAGCGRSGLMARAFAMRLMHMGLTAFVAGGVTSPAIGAGDLLLICSGSGEKKTLRFLIEGAARACAACALVTSTVNSPAARDAELVVLLPAGESRQFGGSLFEQALLLFLDGAVLEIIRQLGISHDEMAGRHANLE